MDGPDGRRSTGMLPGDRLQVGPPVRGRGSPGAARSIEPTPPEPDPAERSAGGGDLPRSVGRSAPPGLPPFPVLSPPGPCPGSVRRSPVTDVPVSRSSWGVPSLPPPVVLDEKADKRESSTTGEGR